MNKKTKTGLMGMFITAGLTLLCGLAYALNEKINGIEINTDFDEEEE